MNYYQKGAAYELATKMDLSYTKEEMLDISRVMGVWDRYKSDSVPDTGVDGIDLPGSGKSITYSRRSSTKDHDGASPERQREDQDWLVQEYGLPPIVERFWDDGYSGTSESRPAYVAMKLFGSRLPGLSLAMEDVDRAVRSGELGFDFGYWAVENHIKVYDKDGLCSYEKLLEKCARASNVHREIVNKTQRALARARRRGIFVTTPPWGYTKPQTGVIVPDPALVPIIQDIFARRFARQSTGQIARWLTEVGIPTATGNVEWSTSSVSNILRNFIFVGLTVTRIKKTGEVIVAESSHTAFVDIDVFEAIQARRHGEKRGRATGPGGGGNRTMLGAKGRCSICGSSWQVSGNYSDGDQSLRCRRHMYGCVGMPYLSRRLCERAVLTSIKHLVHGDGHEESFTESLRRSDRLLEKEREASRRSLDEQIASEKAHISRTAFDAHRFGQVEAMAPVLNAARAKVRELEAKRAKILPARLRADIVSKLETLAGSVDLVANNTPLRRTGKEAEELISSIRAILESVTVEHLADGIVRQTTTFDFNERDDVVHLPELVRKVAREYSQAPFSASVRQRGTIAWAYRERTHALTEAQHIELAALPIVKRHFHEVAPEELGLGFDALAMVIFGNLPLKQSLELHQSGPGTPFWKAFHNMRLSEDPVELIEWFDRNGESGATGRLRRKDMGPQKSVRKELTALEHPILDHPICDPEGPMILSPAHWRLVADRLYKRRGFKGQKQMMETKESLEAYFAVVRVGLTWADAVPAVTINSHRRRVNRFIKDGTFDAICHWLLVAMGKRDEREVRPFPKLGEMRKHTKKTKPGSEE